MNNAVFSSLFTTQFIFGVLQVVTLVKATRCNRRANLTMAAFIATCTLIGFSCYLYYTGRIVEVPHLIRVITPFYALPGVLLFLYAKCLTDKEFKYDWKSLTYFTPFFLSVLSFSPIYFYSVEDKILYYTQSQDMGYRLFIYVMINLSNLGLIGYSYYRVRVYHRAIKNFYSNLSALQFYWIENLFLVSGGIILITFIYALVTLGSDFHTLYFVLTIGLFIQSLFMGYSAMNKVDPLFHLIDDFKTELNEDRKKKRIPDQTYYKLVDLVAGLIKEKIYLDPDLKMQTLAEKTGHPAYLVSLFINKHYDMTFFELINLNRVEEAKRRLLDEQYQHLTILAISQDVGFSSKSAFNSTFKKVTGVTPSEFKSTNS